MSLSPTTNPLRVSTQSALNGDFPRENLFIRSIETLTLGTGTLTQNFGVVNTGELRPLIHSKIVVTGGQFLSDATLTLQSANHVVGDLVTIEFVPSDFPNGRTLTVKDSAGNTLATATNASTSSPINFTLNANNTWLVTDAIADVLPQALSTNNSPTFAALLLQGAAGAGFLTLKSQSVAPAAPASNNISLYADSANKLAWIGASGFTRNFDGTLTASRTYILPDANTSIPVFPQTITFTGPTAPRTVTYPDASFTVARTDAANTFIGHQTIEGVTSAGATGTNNLVFSTSPTFITPVLGAATATSVTLTNGGALNDPGTGALRLIASGTNQSITLTPSGTGRLISSVAGNNANQQMLELLTPNFSGTAGPFINFGVASSANNSAAIQFIYSGGASNSSNYTIIGNYGATGINVNGLGHVLLGGLTTDGTGVLQFPTGTTSAGGITLGNVNIFQNATNSLQLTANVFVTNAAIQTTSNMVLQAGGSFTFLTGDTSSNVQLTKKITSYNGVSTAGQGVPTIQAEGLTATKTANFTVLAYTPPATAGRYIVTGVITTTSATNTGTVQMTLDYVDSQGTTHTADIIPLVDAAGAIATTKTGASKEYHTLPWMFSINNAATVINVKVVITGSVSYTADATIEQVA